jgi:hypothetical protein
MNRRQQRQEAHTASSTSSAGDFKSKAPGNSPLMWVMFLGLLLVYLLLPTKNYFWDGVDFAQNIEDAGRLTPQLFHPNHLIYNPFGYLIYRSLQAVGLNFRALQVLQITNAVLSVVSAYLIFRILKRTLGSRYWSVVLTLLFALSATWWKYSTDADSYIPSCLFLILSFCYLLPDRKARPLVAALLYAVAMMFHQMAVFFFPVLLVGIYLQTRALAPRRRMMLMLQGGAVSFLVTILSYYFSFYLQTGSGDFRTFFRWTTSLSPEPGHSFNVWGNLVYTVNGHVKLFTSGRIIFLKDSIDFWTVCLLLILLTLVVVLLLKVARNFAELKSLLASALRRDEQFHALRILCIVWIATFFIFQYFFIPQHTYYRLFYLPAILVLIGTYLVQYEAMPRRARRYRAALLVAAIAVSNLIFYILPLAQARNYPPLAVALKLNEAWPPGTIVFFASRNSDNSLVRYFNPAAVWVEVNRETIAAEARKLQPGAQSVWLETSLVDLYAATSEGKRWLETHTVREPHYEFVNDKYRLQFYRLKPESFASGETQQPEQ